MERSFIGDPGPGSCLEAGGNDTGAGLCSIGLAVLGSTQAKAHSEPRPFLPTLYVSEMKAESGLSPDSSFIGSRVRSSKVKDAVAPLVSMDSSDSSLDLTAYVEDPKAIVARNVSPVAEGNQYPPIGPPSVIGVEEVADWRIKYNIPADVIIRVPGPEDRVSDFGVDEGPVYEGYFESGFRIESLLWWPRYRKPWRFPQLNPPAWRTLIALQNLGDLQGLVIGVAEVLCSYFVSPLSGAEWRYYLHPRGKEPPVREVPKRERKRFQAFAGNWTKKFAFMRLPGFLPIWQLECRLAVGVTKADLARVDYSSGRETIERVLRLPIERRQIPFLLSKAALKLIDWICFCILGEMSGSKGDEALAEYKKALEVMSARKSAPKRAAFVDDDEVHAYNLNTKVFPSIPVLLASEEDSSVAIQSLQGDFLQVASQLFHLGERMVGAASLKAEMDALASQLREEKVVALAKDKEIKALRLKARNQENWQQRKNVSLRGQLKNREEELNDLKDTSETFEAEKAMVVNGAKVVARWELMREWLNGQTDSWNSVNVLEQYKMVKITAAMLLGLPTPSFEGEPQVPGDIEAEKTPEPAADDPPAS
ncbi:LOW QUALITY PROTEIN: hypothetical protein HID58_006542 [Brassica napus]|uniref:Uncharacterized protein n=1 Tax=Brassica napus TaxID=3708 RepID=A0ABQ8EEQ2_BRANA|nr:LOW QUALITY PROTEIN: hypothetical protein HID58_006542 [Brassica napus]